MNQAPELRIGRNFSVRLNGEQEVDDIAVFDDVVPTFRPQLSSFSCLCLRAVFNQVIVARDLGANEAAFHIRVNAARAFGAGVPSVIFQARASLGAAVKKVTRPRTSYDRRIIRERPGSPAPNSSRRPVSSSPCSS